MRQAIETLRLRPARRGLSEITGVVTGWVDEGPDDMPAHLRTALTQAQLTVPLVDGRLVLGTWQGIYLFEHRRSPSERQIVLHLIGE